MVTPRPHRSAWDPFFNLAMVGGAGSDVGGPDLFTHSLGTTNHVGCKHISVRVRSDAIGCAAVAIVLLRSMKTLANFGACITGT